MRVCTCVHVCVAVCARVCDVCVCVMCVCMCARMRACVLACMHVHACVCACMHAYVLACMRVCMCVCTCMHACCACVCVCVCGVVGVCVFFYLHQPHPWSTIHFSILYLLTKLSVLPAYMTGCIHDWVHACCLRCVCVHVGVCADCLQNVHFCSNRYACSDCACSDGHSSNEKD